MTNKTCKTCNTTKPLIDFNKESKNKDGYRNECRVCRSVKRNASRKKNISTYQNYYKNNKTAIGLKRAEFYRSNDQARISKNLRKKVSDSLRRVGKYGPESIFKLVGCSYQDFFKHLSDLFTEDMTWDNYGTWHIDHKKPCACFDLTKESEQYECFHFSNLQPMLAVDNLSKGSLYEGARHKSSSN